MKKTLTVNLGGIVFHIDEDAYRLLDNYLCNLRIHFRKQQGAEEIVNDIELRICELFTEKVSGGAQVITITCVEEVIARMGEPADFDGTGEEQTSNRNRSSTSKSTNESRSSSFRHRLFRDADNKVLGGIASGVSAYFDWDVTLVRILFIALLFVPYCPMLVLYIIAWIIIPEARTAAEKLSMRGKAVTIENIGKTVTDGFEKVAHGVNDYVNSGKPRTFFQQLGDLLVRVAGFVLKACLVVFAIICSPVVFVLLLLFVVLVFAAISLAIGGGAFLYQLLPLAECSPLSSVSPMLSVFGSMAGIALIAIPLLSIAYSVFRQLFNWSPLSLGVKWTFLVLWLLSLTIFIISLSATSWQLPLYLIQSI